jgi:hypothetical protein
MANTFRNHLDDLSRQRSIPRPQRHGRWRQVGHFRRVQRATWKLGAGSGCQQQHYRALQLREAMVKLTFLTNQNTPLSGRLSFVKSEYSFSYQVSDTAELQDRTGASGITSLVIDTLQLEVGVESGTVLYAWGFCPMGSWAKVTLSPPTATPGGITVVADEELEYGVSVPLPGENWTTDYDPANGFVKVSRPQHTADHFILIAQDVTLGLDGSDLVELWLHPAIEE